MRRNQKHARSGATSSQQSNKKSFIIGMASVLDIGGTLASYAKKNKKSGPQQDAEALGLDWEAVGNDIRTAMQSARR